MTICVPRKPFEIFGNIIIYCAIFSWIITLPLGFLNVYTSIKYGDTASEFVFGTLALFITLWYLKKENEEKHWIQWCENKHVNTSSEKSNEESKT